MLGGAVTERQPVLDRSGAVVTGRDNMGVAIDERADTRTVASAYDRK